MSKSGSDGLSGFKNLSNSNPYFIGSKDVIDNTKATREPAPEPLPGPTGIPFVFAQLTKSITIKK